MEQDPRTTPSNDAGKFQRWPEQDENGVDLSLIRAALRLSPEERLRRADLGRRQALWIRANAKRIDAKR